MKARKKVRCTIIIAILMALYCSTSVFAASTARDATEGVVLVAQYLDDGSFAGTGTGFAIGEVNKPIQYIVTNYHVIEGAYNTGGSVKVYFSMAANKFMMAEVYWKSQEKDLAVLKLPEATSERKALVICPSDKIDINDNFTAMGYPVASTFDDFTKYDMSDIVITKGGISKIARINETDCYLIDVAISEGNSGGPLVNSKGQVVGVNSFYITSKASESAAEAKFSYAISINELLRNIDPNVIPYTVVDNSILRIIIGIVVAVVVIAGIIFVVLWRKNKKIKSHTNVTVKIERNKVEPSQIVQHKAVYALKSTMGIHTVTQTICIGRDPSICQIAFPLDTPGISGKHCEVIPADNGVYLKDKGSSYGTFLSDGTKLTAESPVKLAEGAEFYLADPRNTFQMIRKL